MIKNYIKLKNQAIELRKIGLSYGNISKKLEVSKSTASNWLQSVKLTTKQRNKLNANRVTHLNFGPNSQKNRRLREVNALIKNAQSEISSNISLESYRLFGVALYWAEGSKSKMLSITNSDPYLILFWVKWLNKILKIPPKSLKVWLNIHSQQNEKDIKRFWSELTNIPIENFGKSYIKPKNKNYKKNNLYYGTARVTALKSTNHRHKVFGWTQAILKDVVPKVILTQKKWRKIQAVARHINIK